MLGSTHRLKKNKNFEKVFQKGRGYKKEGLLLKVLTNNLHITRFGFVVSKKFANKATTRNKIKRQLREIVRKTQSTIKNGIDGIFVALPGLEGKTFKEIKEIVEALFLKSNLYN